MPIEHHSNGDTTLTGNAINWFAAKAILLGLRMYLKHGLKPNRAYTPAAMRDAASRWTGTLYPRSRKGLQAAHDDLAAFLAAHHPDQVERRTHPADAPVAPAVDAHLPDHDPDHEPDDYRRV